MIKILKENIVRISPSALAARLESQLDQRYLFLSQITFFGPAISRLDEVGDVTLVQPVPLVILVVSIMVVGLYPSIISDAFTLGLEPIMESIQTGTRS